MHKRRGLFRSVEEKVNLSTAVYTIFLFLVITTSILPMIMAWDLMTLDSYDAFISLLDKFYIGMLYFANVIIHNLDYMNFHLFKLLSTLIVSLSWMNIIMILLTAYLWAASKERIMRCRNAKWQWIIIIYLVGYACIGMVIIFGFQLISLNTVITLFKYAGIIMFATHLLLIMISMSGLYYEIKNWLNIHKGNDMKKHTG